MRKVSEYESRAARCRELAAKTSNPTQKQQLLDMAAAWADLARDRLVQLGETEMAHQQFSIGPHGDAEQAK